MPFYEYECESCGFADTLLEKFNASKLRNCPRCRKRAWRRLLSPAAFHLKGGGWYATDFRNPPQKPPAADAAKEGGKESGKESGKEGGKESGGKDGGKESGKESGGKDSGKADAAKSQTAPAKKTAPAKADAAK